MTAASFKRSIRDLQVWCSSCMVAFSGSDPVGVLIGAKRPAGTLIHRIAVHPDHRRQGHGRHMLTSLGSKLAILGPPRLTAEVASSLAAACALFGACGYVEEGRLTDYVYDDRDDVRNRGKAGSDHAAATNLLVIPVTVDDLAANGLLGDDHPTTCWERSVETLMARKDDVAGMAVASDERIEAYLLHANEGQILALRSFVEDGGTRLMELLRRVRADTLRLAKVHPAEHSNESLEALGFRADHDYRVFAAKARAG